jgi:hypothetical protein
MKGFRLCSLALLATIIFVVNIGSASAIERLGRLGVGYSSQLKNDLPSISFKLQQSSSFSFGGVFGIDTGDDGGWGAGLKFYRHLFDEPQLNFYAAGLAAIISKKDPILADESGFQFDLTLGADFTFTGLESLGFSFEFGLSLNKIDDFRVQTVGNNFVVAALHFYL